MSFNFSKNLLSSTIWYIKQQNIKTTRHSYKGGSNERVCTAATMETNCVPVKYNWKSNSLVRARFTRAILRHFDGNEMAATIRRLKRGLPGTKHETRGFLFRRQESTSQQLLSVVPVHTAVRDKCSIESFRGGAHKEGENKHGPVHLPRETWFPWRKFPPSPWYSPWAPCSKCPRYFSGRPCVFHTCTRGFVHGYCFVASNHLWKGNRHRPLI